MNLHIELENLLVKGVYNRFTSEVWLWMIFFKNSLREILVSDNHESENEKSEIISIAPESGNMIQGLREILSNTNNDNKNK